MILPKFLKSMSEIKHLRNRHTLLNFKDMFRIQRYPSSVSGYYKLGKIYIYSSFDKGSPKKRKSVRDNGSLRKYSVNFNKSSESILFHQVFIAPSTFALKTREFDDATVNNHNPSCLSVLSRRL